MVRGGNGSRLVETEGYVERRMTKALIIERRPSMPCLWYLQEPAGHP